MLPGNYPLTIYQGQTYTQIFIWTCGPGTPGSVPASVPAVGSTPIPVDLTGYTATMQIRAVQMVAGSLLYDASSDITLGGTAGTITLVISSADTGGFNWFSGFYDLFLTDSSGNAYPLLAGTVTINQAVSSV